MKILLLLYFPRSGSTFFASQVARHFRHVLVVPELRLPLLLASSFPAQGQSARDFLLELVERDYQFEATGLSAQDVEHCIEKMGEYDAERFLTALAQTMAAKKNLQPELVLYKCGAVAHYWRNMRKLMPDIRLVHVYRDGRAAVCSAINSLQPYQPGRKMGRGDPWLQARRWRDYMRLLQKIAEQEKTLIEVRYESLCDQPEQEMSQFSASCNLEPASDSGAGLEVASTEKSIHANVNHEALPHRIDGWKTEFHAWQGVVCESLCLDELKRLGYESYFTQRQARAGRFFYLARGYVYHLYASVGFYLYLLRRGCSDPRGFLRLMQMRLRKRKIQG